MFKKSILTVSIILCLVACFTLPCFADSSSLNLLPQNMNSWSTEPLYDTMSPIPTITFTPARLENRIRFEDTTADHSYCFVRFPAADLNGLYTLDFDYYGNFSLVNMELWLFFGQDVFDLNNSVNPLVVSSQTGSGSSPAHFHLQFIPSNYVESIEKVGIMFGFIRENGSSGTNLYINNISLTSSNPLDSGFWQGPNLEIDDIDLSSYITGMSDSGNTLINFITNGFSYARKGVIGVAGLFSLVWNYLSEHSPVIPYVIVFGLVLGLVAAILSAFNYSKDSGTSSYSRDAYDLYNKRFMNRAIKHMKKTGSNHYSEL